MVKYVWLPRGLAQEVVKTLGRKSMLKLPGEVVSHVE